VFSDANDAFVHEQATNVVREQVRYVGRVQGVGFRATARDIAREHAVTGWVRNEPDATVLMQVQGAKEEVARFRAALRERMQRCIEHEHAGLIQPVAQEAGFAISR
jgi:acylphosphatase